MISCFCEMGKQIRERVFSDLFSTFWNESRNDCTGLQPDLAGLVELQQRVCGMMLFRSMWAPEFRMLFVLSVLQFLALAYLVFVVATQFTDKCAFHLQPSDGSF